MRKSMVEKRNEELEDTVPTLRGLIFWSRRWSRPQGLKKKWRRRNRCPVDTLMQTVLTKYRMEKSEGSRPTGFQEKRALGPSLERRAGSRLAGSSHSSHLAKSTSPLHPRAVQKEIVPACEQSSSLRPGQQGQPDRSVPLGKGPLTSSQRDAPGWGRWPM